MTVQLVCDPAEGQFARFLQTPTCKGVRVIIISETIRTLRRPFGLLEEIDRG